MSMLTLEAKLERHDSTTPWGFRMQGGKDFSSPLTIQRVNPGSLAAKCGLQAGDIILKIGNIGCDTLRHKEAQDTIVSYGNRLDLLLQRGGGLPIPQSTYEKFQTPVAPSFNNYQSPGGFPSSAQNFNTAAKPFGANPASNPPYNPSMDNLSQKTQNMSISNQQDYMSSAQKYTEREDKPNPAQHQSKSFKYLQDLIEGGHEPPTSLKPLNPPFAARSKSPQNASSPAGAASAPGQGKQTVKAIMAQQYNNPIGLYSNENVVNTFKGQSKFLLNPDGKEELDVVPPEPVLPAPTEFDAQGRKIYHPSETYKLIQEAESNESNAPLNQEPAHSRTFKRLQQQLGSDNDRGSMPPAAPSTGPKATPWTPPAPKGPPAKSGPPPSAGRPWAPPNPPAARPGGAPARPPGTGVLRGKKGDAVFRQQESAAGRMAVCASCNNPIRGPFVLAVGKSWCPDHFICANPNCGTKLIDIGFVEEAGRLYCERDYELYFAPHCAKCGSAIIGECVNALQKSFHPQCFLCTKCHQPIGGNQFHIEEGEPYCERDWAQMFQTMCAGCNYPIEPGDRWVEAMSQSFHSECFNCSTCQKSLEGQPFFVKAGKQYCKQHAR